jgi:6,7-dimethyl-8-ribityllumazine synthase
VSEIRGDLHAASRFNELVTRKLLEGALAALATHGVAVEDVDVVWVPGAFELPLVARRLAGSRTYDAVICLGCVIRGETVHFEHVAGQAAAGIREAGQTTGVPVTFGVLTTETLEQALDRAGGKHGNKGWDAATAAIEMSSLLEQLPKEAEP